jgi:hypothetical protein
MSSDQTKQEEFQFLGKHTLQDVKDALYCVNGVAFADIVEPSQEQSPCGFAECCFFIEGVFYCDDRGVDLSLVRLRGIEWMKRVYATHRRSVFPRRWKRSRTFEPSRGGGEEDPVSLDSRRSDPEPTVDQQSQTPRESSPSAPLILPEVVEEDAIVVLPMRETTLSTLHFRVGIQYLYSHMSQVCEHYLYFSDVRLCHPDTDLYRNESVFQLYPRMTFMAKFKRRKCGICQLWSAQFMVYGDRLTITNPTFFCQHCYFLFHYDCNGNLLYNDFTVFPYVHDMR